MLKYLDTILQLLTARIEYTHQSSIQGHLSWSHQEIYVKQKKNLPVSSLFSHRYEHACRGCCFDRMMTYIQLIEDNVSDEFLSVKKPKKKMLKNKNHFIC